jgi:hypothetical protein
MSDGDVVSEDLPRRQTLFLYMVTNRKEGVQSVTRIGCVSDPIKRLAIFNSPTPTPGSDRRARQAAGHWNLLLVIAVPPELSGTALKEEWRKSTRKIHKRFEYGIVCIARHHGLPHFVDIDELSKDARIIDELPDLVKELHQQVQRSGCDLKHLAEQVSNGRLPIRLSSSSGLSFAHADRPRDRYRKRSRADSSTAGAQLTTRVKRDAAARDDMMLTTEIPSLASAEVTRILESAFV